MTVLPPHVDGCDCGAARRNIETTEDGLSTRYDCGDCGELLADEAIGAEP